MFRIRSKGNESPESLISPKVEVKQETEDGAEQSTDKVSLGSSSDSTLMQIPGVQFAADGVGFIGHYTKTGAAKGSKAGEKIAESFTNKNPKRFPNLTKAVNIGARETGSTIGGAIGAGLYGATGTALYGAYTVMETGSKILDIYCDSGEIVESSYNTTKEKTREAIKENEIDKKYNNFEAGAVEDLENAGIAGGQVAVDTAEVLKKPYESLENFADKRILTPADRFVGKHMNFEEDK
jgi:hypothetical protein